MRDGVQHWLLHSLFFYKNYIQENIHYVNQYKIITQTKGYIL